MLEVYGIIRKSQVRLMRKYRRISLCLLFYFHISSNEFYTYLITLIMVVKTCLCVYYVFGIMLTENFQPNST